MEVEGREVKVKGRGGGLERNWGVEKEGTERDRRLGGTRLSGLAGVVPQHSLIAPPVFFRR